MFNTLAVLLALGIGGLFGWFAHKILRDKGRVS